MRKRINSATVTPPAPAQTYAGMLAGRGLAVGDYVVCEYRTPSPNQHWIHPFWVGIIEPVGTDVKAWNGTNTEEYYCLLTHTVRVRYLPSMAGEGHDGHTQRDALSSLNVVHQPPMARLSEGPLDESPYFGSNARELCYQFACSIGMGERYAELHNELTEVI